VDAQLDASRARAEPAPPRREASIPQPVFERAEVRDVLAWLRLLVEPQDAAAAVRALGRPPVELRQVDLARVVQIARRRRLDVVAALGAASESPQLAPQARERIERFQNLYGWATAAIDSERAEAFVAGLIERLGLRRRQLFAADEQDLEDRIAGLASLCELAKGFERASPGASARELAAHLTTVAARPALEPGPERPTFEAPAEPTAPEGAGERSGSEPSDSAARARDTRARRPLEEQPDPQGLREMLSRLRTEVLGDVTRIAERIGELRLDTDLDVSHGIVRYLELIKLAALVERDRDRDPDAAAIDAHLDDTMSDAELQIALADINARLLAALTPLQREIYESSPLDGLLVGASDGEDAQEQGARGTATSWAGALGPRGEPSLEAFLPRRGEGLALSASDVVTYRGCPLRYKFARVLRIPVEQTLNQRFGIVVHQVLERYHGAEEQTLGLMMDLLDTAWRRAGLGEGELERRLRVKARAALVRYHERLREEASRPLWFERSFAFDLGPHHVRGRVDRVDALPDGGYELIDYKTGHAKTAAELRDDIQLSLYAIAAREAWQLESSKQAYYYLLDDRRVPVPRGEDGEQWVRETVLRVGEGIMAQDFEPTPSPAVCALCDYRIVCPAAER
jgi:DNA helicase-2/ATP-dependent DNA helicase PcrA